MKCEKCGAPLEDGQLFCPHCDLETPAEEERLENSVPAEMELLTVDEKGNVELPKQEPIVVPEMSKQAGGIKIWQVILAILSTAVLTTALVLVVLVGSGVELKIPNFFKNDITRKDSYTATNPDKTASTVVAILGDHKLTNSLLQIYYWSQVYDFIDYFGEYLPQTGLDYTKPLDEQVSTMDESGLTWQQYFLNAALETWQRYVVLDILAERDGFQLDEEYQKILSEAADTMAKTAEKAGYASADELLAKEMGAGVTVEDYVEYLRLSYVGLYYFNRRYESIVPTQQEIETFYANHKADFANQGITKDSGDFVDVRHILLVPENGVTDETTKETTYSEADWEACRVKAQAMLDQWLADGGTEKAFAELANANSKDGGSNTKGGLYTQVYKGKMVEAFDAWIFDETRKPGDSGLVKTEFGYHLMYFVNIEEQWAYYARTEVMSEKMNQVIEDGMETWPMKTTYRKIHIAEVDLAD